MEHKPDGREVIIHYVSCKSRNESNADKFPLVLIHGYAGGLPYFYKNYSSLCENRKVYAIDLPGFALSTRVQFKNDHMEEMIDLIEEWRSKMAIRYELFQFIILNITFNKNNYRDKKTE